MSRIGSLLGGVACVALAGALPAFGQTQETPAQAQPQEERDVVVITGTRIAGVEAVGSTVVALGEEEIAAEPAATVQDLMKTLPQVVGFGFDSSSAANASSGGTNTTRGSAINLRGIGPQATLTLLDGLRLPTSGVNGSYVDPTGIPAIALRSIEVVPDGASALYGSDAVAGVVNFILNTDDEGLRTRVRYGQADGYDLFTASGTYGFSWGSGHAFAALEYNEHSALSGFDRDFYRADLRPLGGSDLRITQCNPGNVMVGGVSYAIPAGGVTPATASQLLPNTVNRCDVQPLNDILPEERRHTAIGHVEQDINDSISVYGRVLYTERDYWANAVQQGSTSILSTLTVPATNAFFVRPPGTTGAVTVQYDFQRDIGPVNQTGAQDLLFIATGADFKLPGEWSGDIDIYYGRDDSQQYTRRILTQRLTAALASSNPATAFNPFGGTNSQSVVNSILSGVFNPYARSFLTAGNAQVNGPLFDLPGGAVRLAAGAEYQHHELSAGSVQNDLLNPTLAFVHQSRDVKSAFAELYVPIFGEGNAIPGFHRMLLSLAYRWDEYSDVGETSNPKIGLTWEPVEDVALRATYGTSFRAPALQDLLLLRAGSGLTISTVPDPLGGSTSGYSVNAGNPNLTPEDAETWSVGADWEPAFLSGFRASAGYYSIEYTNQVVYPPRNTTILSNPIYLFALTRNPTPADISFWTSRGLAINGNPLPTPGFLYDGSARNLGSTKQAGWDFDVSYEFETGFGDFALGFNGTYVDTYELQITPLATPTELVGTINAPMELRTQAVVDWSLGDFSAQGAWNHAASYSNTAITPVQDIDAWDTFDLRFTYTWNDLGLSLDVTNVFDEDPPFVNIQGGYDPGGASAIGRFIALTIDKRW